MATRVKATNSTKAPAVGKTKSASGGKPTAKAKTTTKLAAVAARTKSAVPRKTATKAVAPAEKTRPAAAKKLPAAKPAKPPVSHEQRRNYIEVAAYYIAERRGFFGASALEDWTQAEAEVDRMLSEGKLNQ